MTNTKLAGIRTWFEEQIQTYASASGMLPPLLQLKLEHSERVARDSRAVAQEMGWNTADVHVAEAGGWLHDVGRFSQFAEFGTFSDRRSVDHGRRGWEILKSSGVLAALPERDRDAILASVRYHNARLVPDHVPPHVKPYLDLIRDTDKLDIFRIVIDAVRKDGFRELPEMLPQVRLDGPINPVLLEEIETRRCASLENVTSLTDFLLLQLSWVYDINYPATFRRIVDRHMVASILEHLPHQDGKISRIVQAADRYARERA